MSNATFGVVFPPVILFMGRSEELALRTPGFQAIPQQDHHPHDQQPADRALG